MRQTIRVSLDRGFTIPRECQGQTVEESYGCGVVDGTDRPVIIWRSHDRSDGTIRTVAYAWPRGEAFEPQNGAPKLGRRIGSCVVVDRASPDDLTASERRARIRAVRVAAGHTQGEAAALLGVPRRTWENWEGDVSAPSQPLLDLYLLLVDQHPKWRLTPRAVRR